MKKVLFSLFVVTFLFQTTSSFSMDGQPLVDSDCFSEDECVVTRAIPEDSAWLTQAKSYSGNDREREMVLRQIERKPACPPKMWVKKK